MGTESEQDQRRQIWNRVAPGYGNRHESSETNFAAVSDWLIDRSGPRPGHVVLDLAGGAGGLGHRVATIVGPGGRVISTDFAPEMVTFSQQLGDAQGLQNVDYQVLDAQEMDLGSGSVDIILCRSALMVMPDPAAALRESRRVLKPGGALAFSVFTNAANNPWVTLQMRSFAERGLVTPPPPDAPGMFSLGDPHKIQALATDAGFTELDIEAVPFTFHWPDADAIWGTVVDINALLGPIVKALPAEEAQSIRAAVIDDYSAYQADDGSYAVPAEAQAVLAR